MKTKPKQVSFAEPIVDSNESCSDEESEDETVWSTGNERGFLRALGAIKSGDPKIYNNDIKFYNSYESEDEGNKPTSSKSLKRKHEEKMTLRDYERKLIVERSGRLSDDDDDDDDEKEECFNNNETYASKEQRLKDEFKSLLNAESDSDDEELLKKRVKTEEQKKVEENDYYEWLKGGNSLEVFDEDLEKLKKRWTKREELDDEELFLRDYLLEKKYENEIENEEIPSYEDIVREEEEEDKAEEFEHKFNFRFEEPDQEFIKQYPRTIKESVRTSRTRRREKRKEEKRAEKDLIEKILNEPDSGDDDTQFRFRYRSVPANNFGLTTEEILTVDDKQLNAWVSVKNVCAYRSNEEEEREILRYERLVKNVAKKEKIFEATAPVTKEELIQSVDKTPKRGKKIQSKANSRILKNDGKGEVMDDSKKPSTQTKGELDNAVVLNGKSKKNRRQKHKGREADETELDSDRLRAYGVRTKKLKRLLYNKKLKKRLNNVK